MQHADAIAAESSLNLRDRPAAGILIPHDLEEALDALAQEGSPSLVMAGGTQLMLGVNRGALRPRRVISLTRLDLAYIRAVDGAVHIGATTPVETLSAIAEDYPTLRILGTSAHHVACEAIRRVATVGGNLFCAHPFGDLLLPLLVLDASARLRRAGGERLVSMSELQPTRRPDELLTEIVIPPAPGRTAFTRVARSRSMSIPVVAAATQVLVDEQGRCAQVRIAIGGASAIPYRALAAEAALHGQFPNEQALQAACAVADRESSAHDDALATAWYRRRLIPVLARRVLEEALQ